MKPRLTLKDRVGLAGDPVAGGVAVGKHGQIGIVARRSGRRRRGRAGILPVQ